MNRTLALALALLLIAATPAPMPLVVGSVRDQYGVPIDGARIRLFDGARATATASTSADGTFAVAGRADAVEVDCAYCEPARYAVAGDATVVAIVRRYERIRNDLPTNRDLPRLPYAYVESDLALAPFVVLNESSRTIPGPSLSDRGATGRGGLLVLDGVPDYDIVANTTPFDTIAQRDSTQVNLTRTDGAYRYGDVAGAGTFFADTTGGSSQVIAGNDLSVRAAASAPAGSAAAAYSNWQYGDRRAHAAGDATFLTPGMQGDATLYSGSGSLSPGGESEFSSSFSAGRLSIESLRGIDTFADATVDRGTYDYTSANFPVAAAWSDTNVSAGVRSHATVAPFALFDIRNSAGWYWSRATARETIAATLAQARANGGIRVAQSAYDALVAFGNDNVVYGGGYPGAAPIGGSATDAVASLDVHPGSHWNLHASTSSGYTLQTFLGLYGPGGSGPVEQNATTEATLGYGDDHRVRASITALRWRGALGDATSSSGASISWQIAPALSVRTWLLQVRSTAFAPAVVGSTWMTYEGRDGFRIDAIWARDLLDRVARGHLDAAISGRVTPKMQWFLASEVREGKRATSAGLRF